MDTATGQVMVTAMEVMVTATVQVTVTVMVVTVTAMDPHKENHLLKKGPSLDKSSTLSKLVALLCNEMSSIRYL